jgi:hypothetical protein
MRPRLSSGLKMIQRSRSYEIDFLPWRGFWCAKFRIDRPIEGAIRDVAPIHCCWARLSRDCQVPSHSVSRFRPIVPKPQPGELCVGFFRQPADPDKAFPGFTLRIGQQALRQYFLKNRNERMAIQPVLKSVTNALNPLKFAGPNQVLQMMDKPRCRYVLQRR